MADEVLKTEVDPTAWGSVHAFLAAATADGAMPTTMGDLGAIDTDALSLEVSDGTVYQLKDINGKILDELKLEPEITVKFTLLKPSEETRGKFWDTEVIGVGAERKFRIKSLISNEKKAFKFANINAIGSETFEVPFCAVDMKPGYSAQKGYTAECSVKLLNGVAGYLFDFGTVPAPVPEA